MPLLAKGETVRKVSVVLAALAAGAIVSGCITSSDKSDSSTKTTFTASDWIVSASALNAQPAGSVKIIETSVTGTAHISGAVSTIWQNFSTWQSGGYFTLKTPIVISGVIDSLGINAGDFVVVYDPGQTPAAFRLAWALRAAGVNAAVLDGGLAAWTAAGYSTKTTVSSPAMGNFICDSLDSSLIATKAQVNAMRTAGTGVILDSRDSTTEYLGDTTLTNDTILYDVARSGHIAGAESANFVNVFNADGTIKAKTDIDKYLAGKGWTSSKPVIAYCTCAVRSSVWFFVFKQLGYDNILNYDGSMYEWAADHTLPMKVGSQP